MTDEVRIEYMPLSQLVRAPRNPKEHDLGAIAASVKRFGYVAAIVLDEGTGRLVAGHGRLDALQAMKAQGQPAPDRVRVQDGEWLVPVQRGVTFADPDEAEAYLVADNRTVELGGWDEGILTELLSDLAAQKRLEGTGFDEDDLDALLGELHYEEGLDVPANALPNPRELPLDLVYTLQGADATCCLAVRAGLQYGVQSGGYRLCPYVGYMRGAHKVTFVDNDYFNYNHSVHLAAVKDLAPRYATVRDIMDTDQCKQAGIEFYSLAQILDWAQELEQFAEHVIVIPKYDCLDEIPERFILGYSVPTSHGGTPLPVSAFAGRRVHLLGGSWPAQLAHMAQLGDDVISLDTNYVQRQAQEWGQYIEMHGEPHQLKGEGFGYVTNPRYVALALSFGAMGAMLHELYPQSQKPAQAKQGQET